MLRAAEKRLFVGGRLGDVVYPRIVTGLAPPVLLTPACDEFAVSTVIRMGATSTATWLPAAAAWPSANDPIAVEFWLGAPITVYQLGWQNGSGTMTDSCDVGIYDASWVRKVSTGGTARTGVSALQFVDVTDTVIGPGRYRLVMSNNGTTAAQQMFWPGVGNAVMWGMCGLLDSATDAYPLPDPLTNMAASAVAVSCPLMIIASRALV